MKFTYIEDYYDAVQKRFPDLERWEIEKILKHGMQSFFMLNNKGADVIIKSAHNSFTMYFGKLFRNLTLRGRYYNIKMSIKLRIKYIFNTKVWDGYYYFGLTEEDYKKYNICKGGRLKKKILFDKIVCYKIPEEAFLNKPCKYFFKLKTTEDRGMIFTDKNYLTRNIQLFAKRDNNGKIIYE